MNKDLRKEFVTKTKWIFSSLFARNMPHVIIGCPKVPDTTFIASNIPIEEMEIYEPTADYYIHKCDITDIEYYSLLVSKFPVLKDNVIYLNTAKFLSAFNKFVKDLDITEMLLVNDKIVLKCLDQEFVIGDLISEFTSNLYYNTWESGLVKGEQPYIKILQEADMNLDNPTFFNVMDHCPEYTGKIEPIKIIITAGRNTISVKEYFKKTNMLEYGVELKVGVENRAIKIQCSVKTPLVNVISVQPAIRYYSLK